GGVCWPDKPIPPPPPAPPAIDTVMLPPLVEPDSVIFAPPASTSCALARPVVPAVLPPVEKHAESCVSPVVPGAEMISVLADKPSEMMQAPETLSELSAYVLELDCPVVLPCRYAPPVV